MWSNHNSPFLSPRRSKSTHFLPFPRPDLSPFLSLSASDQHKLSSPPIEQDAWSIRFMNGQLWCLWNLYLCRYASDVMSLLSVSSPCYSIHDALRLASKDPLFFYVDSKNAKQNGIIQIYSRNFDQVLPPFVTNVCYRQFEIIRSHARYRLFLHLSIFHAQLLSNQCILSISACLLSALSSPPALVSLTSLVDCLCKSQL